MQTEFLLKEWRKKNDNIIKLERKGKQTDFRFFFHSNEVKKKNIFKKEEIFQ